MWKRNVTIYHKLVLAKEKALCCIFGKESHFGDLPSLFSYLFCYRHLDSPTFVDFYVCGRKFIAFETNQGCFCACVCLFIRLSVCLSEYISATAQNRGKKILGPYSKYPLACLGLVMATAAASRPNFRTYG